MQIRVEAYPDLRASGPVEHLSRTLTEIEEQVSAARRAQNAQAMTMNNLVDSFPSLIVARLIGFERLESFEIAPAERTAPSVNLSA